MGATGLKFGVTVGLMLIVTAEVIVPKGVVADTIPVPTEPATGVTTSCVGELEFMVAPTPLIVTAVALLKLVPFIVKGIPTQPFVVDKLIIDR